MASKTRVNFYGGSELLQKLEKAGANIEKEIIKAIHRGNEKPKQDMLSFIQSHRDTGVTEDSWVEEIESKDGVIYSRIGFSVRKGGIASIFLNLGGLHTPPTYFIDKAVENNIDVIKRAQENALKEAFKELL